MQHVWTQWNIFEYIQTCWYIWSIRFEYITTQQCPSNVNIFILATCLWLLYITINMSSIFYCNSLAFASEKQEDIEDMCLVYSQKELFQPQYTNAVTSPSFHISKKPLGLAYCSQHHQHVSNCPIFLVIITVCWE